ncbi:MAG: helicase-related protein, partial [Gammaproteobacteria bacterium]
LFCNTKQMAQQTADELCQRGFSASALHGDLDQKKRDQTLERFANKSMSILVATDVAARGIDIDRLDLVINYDFARDSDIHLHRVGRTGRAGKGGTACTLVTAQEGNQLARLEQNLNLAIEIQPLPDSALLAEPAYLPERVTLQIEAGKKQKLRPGDILGALTAKQGIDASQVGRITIGDRISYVAVHRNAAEAAVEKLRSGKLKGRNFSTRKLGNH